MKQSKVVGITGGIASGKSTVSNYLREKGIFVFDSDVCAKEALSKGSMAYQRVIDAFGAEIVTKEGEIDRRKLGSIIFYDEEKRNLLNQIVHPYVFKKIKEYILCSNEKVVFLDIPLLLETRKQYEKYEIHFDWIVLVNTSEELQLSRLMERDGIPKDVALKKINSQIPLKEKMSLVDIIIENRWDLSELYRLVDEKLEGIFLER